MSLRFRRRIRIAPGISVNLSKSGVGLSAGPRGAKVGVGPRGPHHSVGLPGSGLHYRKQSSWGASGEARSGRGSDSSASNSARSGNVEIRVNDDGSVDVVDLQGYPLAPRLVKVLREQQGEKIQRFLESQCERWNSDIDAILSIHASTPDPAGQASFTAAPFMAPAPDPFVPKKPGLLGLIWRQYRERVERENETRQRAWNASVSEWQQDRKAHEEREEARRYDWEVGRASDVSSMERVLEERLASFDWPRETLITYQFQDDGKSVWLDVDLPEVEDMPTKQARVAARGLRLNIKDKSEAQVRKDYMRHVHGILFRLIGEAFYTLPAVDEVVASGYSQRPDPGTGHVRDDYLLSVRVQRTDWVAVNFQNLEALDIVASLERFDLTRKMTKGGVFTPIEPLVPEEHPA